MSDTTPKLVVHTSPPLNPLPASDVESIRLLATVCAGGVNKAGVTTADWGANGKPLLTYDGAVVSLSNLGSVSTYRSPDQELSSSKKADILTWSSYIEGKVTDLIYHSLYSLPPNYPFLAATQLAALPFPMNYYVPQRLRSIHRTRLEAVGLWGVAGLHHGDAVDEDRKRLEETVVVAPGGTKTERKWSGWNAGRLQAERSRQFGEEKIRQHAKIAFEPLARKLGDRPFFLSSRPSTLDIALFANLTLVLSPDLPNPLLATYLRTEFPTLVEHHDRVLKAIWPRRWESIPRVVSPRPPSLISSLRSFFSSRSNIKTPESDDLEHQMASLEARTLSIGRWVWFAGAGAAFIAYVLASGIISIDFGDDDDEMEIWVEDDDDAEGDAEGGPLSAFVEDEDDMGDGDTFVDGLPVEDDEE